MWGWVVAGGTLYAWGWSVACFGLLTGRYRGTQRAQARSDPGPTCWQFSIPWSCWATSSLALWLASYRRSELAARAGTTSSTPAAAVATCMAQMSETWLACILNMSARSNMHWSAVASWGGCSPRSKTAEHRPACACAVSGVHAPAPARSSSCLPAAAVASCSWLPTLQAGLDAKGGPAQQLACALMCRPLLRSSALPAATKP